MHFLEWVLMGMHGSGKEGVCVGRGAGKGLCDFII